MSKRKYKRGILITSIDELSNEKLIWDARTNKVYDRGWFQSWQFRYAVIGIKCGWFYTVEPIGEEKNESNRD